MIRRSPTSDELSACVQYLAKQAQQLASPARLAAFDTGPAGAVKPSDCPTQRARESLVHVLFNHHDFVTIH
jgi:hypothetical protein